MIGAIISQLQNELDKVQAELVQADVAAIEATAFLEEARSTYDKISAAVAAINGETPAEPSVPSIQEQPAGQTVVDTASGTPDPLVKSRDETEDMTPQEFNAYRKRRQKARTKEVAAQNPLAHIKCSGCGQTGTLQDTVIQAPSGASVRMMICSSCGNQVMS